jgi:hypothetical protein
MAIKEEAHINPNEINHASRSVMLWGNAFGVVWKEYENVLTESVASRAA